MALLAIDKKTKPELRGRMFSELAKYRWPQLKAVEHSGPGGGSLEPVRVIVEYEDRPAKASAATPSAIDSTGEPPAV
jgi:hypothetical protein